jgi:DNA polymerase
LEVLNWKELLEKCTKCHSCDLHKDRKNVVFGEGDINAKLMLIGEGPGADEDETGRPFVGKAGKLLTLALEALEIKREEIYIANIIKCRPPGNRNPLENEAQKCIPYLRNQVALIRPKIIVCLGAVAMKYIIGPEHKITKVRGQWIERKNCHIIATYHPAALLRDENKKVPFWYDMKKVLAKLNE